jgi:DNA-binding MarR family transcriptional regulator
MKHYAVGSFKARHSIGYLLKRSHSLLMERAEAAFENHDITFMQWVVLVRLRDGLGNTAAELCRGVGHDSGALTRMLDQLEARGLVERKRSKADRRVVELSLTRQGEAMVESLIPLAVDNLNESVQDFTAAEFREFLRLLEKLIVRLESAPAQPPVKAARARK